MKIRVLFQYKDSLSRYGDSHYEDKRVSRPSFLYNGNPYTGKTGSLYWDSPLFTCLPECYFIVYFLSCKVPELFHNFRINSLGVEMEIFQKKLDQCHAHACWCSAPCRPSATMIHVLTMMNKQVLFFQKEVFQLPAPSPCWEMIKKCKYILMFSWNKFSMTGLTHWGLVMHICINKLGNYWFT